MKQKITYDLNRVIQPGFLKTINFKIIKTLSNANRQVTSLVSDVVEYVTTEKLLESIFNVLPVLIRQREIQTLGLYWLITFYFEAFFLKERMNISDSLYKLRISHRMSFSHYKQNTRVSQI
jgi:hypothetical protein